MPLSIPGILLVAKQREILELEHLKTRANLVGVLSHLIHVLQAERGASSLYLAAGSDRLNQSRQEYAAASQTVETLLRDVLEHDQDLDFLANAKLLSLTAWVLIGLDSLPNLRGHIDHQHITGEEAVTAFSRIIAGLISLIFEVADATATPEVSGLLVALVNLVQGKELAGQERAVGALIYGSGKLTASHLLRVQHLMDAQDRNFRVFNEFAGPRLAEQWQAMTLNPHCKRLAELRELLLTTPPDSSLNQDLGDEWFETCSARLTDMWGIQRKLVEKLQKESDLRIEQAQRELQDTQGLLQSVQDQPPSLAKLVDHFFDPNIPIEQALNFMPPLPTKTDNGQSMAGLLQRQSEQLASTESELAAARQALQENRLIERAKGILMANAALSEDAAYRWIRTQSMNKNQRMIEVAKAILAKVA